MPKYKNNNNYTTYLNNIKFAPGAEISIPLYAPDELGLTQTAAEPIPPTQILLSQQITITAGGSTNIVVPSCDKFSLSIMTKGSDEAVITIGGKTININAVLGLSLSGLYRTRNAKFSVSSTAGATVSILVVEE